MTQITYDAQKVAFEQTTCTFCREDYLPQQTVTELKCRHIFHSICFDESWKVCPLCRHSIQRYDLNELTPYIQMIFQKVLGLSPVNVLLPDKAMRKTLRFVIALLNRELEREYTVFEREYTVCRFPNPIQVLRELNSSLQVIKEGTEEEWEQLVQRDAGLLSDNMYVLIDQLPLKLSGNYRLEEYSKLMEFAEPELNPHAKLVDLVYQCRSVSSIDKIRKVLEFTEEFDLKQQRDLKKYTDKVYWQFKQDRRWIDLFETKVAFFVQLAEGHLNSLNFFSRIQHVEILTNFERSRLRHMRIVVLAPAIHATTIMFLAVFCLAMIWYMPKKSG